MTRGLWQPPTSLCVYKYVHLEVIAAIY